MYNLLTRVSKFSSFNQNSHLGLKRYPIMNGKQCYIDQNRFMYLEIYVQVDT